MFRAMQAQPGVAASQDNRNDLLVRGGGAIENQTRIDGFDVPTPTTSAPRAARAVRCRSSRRGSSSALRWRSGLLGGLRRSDVVGRRRQPEARAHDRIHATAGVGVGGAMAIARPDRRLGIVARLGARSLLEVAFRDETAEAVPAMPTPC